MRRKQSIVARLKLALGSEAVIDAQAQRVSALARDLSELMSEPGLREPVARLPKLTVGYHAACSLQHGQQIRIEPKALLAAAGFAVVEPRDNHLCCGSAGTYNLMQPEIAGELRRRKVATLEGRRPDLIGAGNIGCIVQIGSDTALPVVHTAELLDWATGGPKPTCKGSPYLPISEQA